VEIPKNTLEGEDEEQDGRDYAERIFKVRIWTKRIRQDAPLH
jgi:hypothetical protein